MRVNRGYTAKRTLDSRCIGIPCEDESRWDFCHCVEYFPKGVVGSWLDGSKRGIEYKMTASAFRLLASAGLTHRSGSSHEHELREPRASVTRNSKSRCSVELNSKVHVSTCELI